MTSLTQVSLRKQRLWNRENADRGKKSRKKNSSSGIPVFWKKNSQTVLAGVSLAALICLWQAASLHQWVNSSILPAPSLIFEKLVTMIQDHTLAEYTLISLKRVMSGYFLGGGIGLLFGILIGLSKRLERFMQLYIGILRPIPPIAWIPFLILALGIDETSKITVIAIGSFWPLLLNSIEGVHAADEQLLELGRVLEKDKKTIFFKIILPAALPAIFTGAKLGISRAWSCVVTAEMIAASAGVGYLIQYARELSQPAVMLVGVAVIGLIGLLIDVLMSLLQKKVLYWNSAA